MTTKKTSHPLNTLSFLSEEVERTLRLRAWRDEIFREALIADPKGVIQRLFPQCFPNGKLPEQLTIKVIEEDLDTCHIVLPSLPDEFPTPKFPTPEIPEEEQLEFVANMGCADRTLGRRDSSDNKGGSQLSEKTRPLNLLKDSFKRQQAEEAAKKQETASEPLTKEKLMKDIRSLAKKDEAFRKNILEDPKKALQDYFPHYFNGSNGSEKQTFKVTQDIADTHHIVLPSSRDDFGDRGVPKEPEPDNASCCCSNKCCMCNSNNGS